MCAPLYADLASDKARYVNKRAFSGEGHGMDVERHDDRDFCPTLHKASL